MVDGEFLVDYLLQVLAYVPEAEVQALQGLQLGGYACGEGADCYVADVAEEVLDADFFGFFGFDYRGGVHEGFGCGRAVLFVIPSFDVSVGFFLFIFFVAGRGSGGEGKTYIFDFFNGKVCIRRHTDFFWLHVYDDEQRIGCVALEELIDLEIRRS